ncbi:diaminopimelate epimerase [Brevundimonas balnearis]|uniref:Diaminopimelate epimerase n=1 Tax=Brevundimonas balnearis TaxID=1572858 RepID=A0ABV6R1Y8_9CAUL
MATPYVKMNGLGNDFAVVRVGRDWSPSEAQVRAWADRASGIGFDQLIALSEGDGGPWVRFWNSDGGEVSACGNGSRAAAWLMMEATGTDRVGFGTPAGPLSAERAGDRRVTVDMGAPRLNWDRIPLAEEMDTRGIELQVGPIDDPVVHTPGAVSMGNPHVVFFTDRQDDAFVRGTGSLIEHHPLFPEGVNVGFANVLGRDRIRLRVWERGAGLTKACGTGACAALVAAARRGLTDRAATLQLDGGELRIVWDEATDHVLMTGGVEVEGTGVLPETSPA